MKRIITAVILFAATIAYSQNRADSLLNHTVVIGGDVFTAVEATGDMYILHAESCKHVVLCSSMEDILSLLYWIEQYPCEELRYAQSYYQELVEEKIWE